MIFEFVSGHLQLGNTANEKNMNQLFNKGCFSNHLVIEL